MNILFSIECGLVKNQGPDAELYVNDILIQELHLGGVNFVSIDIDNSIDNNVTIVHKNKTDLDTVIQDGKIVEDKYLKVTKIWVDDILLVDLLCKTTCSLQYSKSYLDTLPYTPPTNISSDSLYFNGRLTYTFNKDFFIWYHYYKKDLDMQYVASHPDREAEEKFLGYEQESSAEQEIIDLLKTHGYSITR